MKYSLYEFRIVLLNSSNCLVLIAYDNHLNGEIWLMHADETNIMYLALLYTAQCRLEM